MRAPAFLVVLFMSLATLPASNGAADPLPQVFFRDDFEAGTQGWWGDPGWGTTDNRARSGGHALYFGNDKGTHDPADNDLLFCDGTFCQHEVRSPVFSLPVDSAAHVYFWAYLDVHWMPSRPTLKVDVEVLDAHDDVVERVELLEVDPVQGWIFHTDMSDKAGERVRLVFDAVQYWLVPGNEGIYIDDVVVTDVHVETETVHQVVGGGPSTRTVFEAGPEPMIIESRIEGEFTLGTWGILYSAQHEDGPRRLGGVTGTGPIGFGVGVDGTEPVVVYHLPNGVTATALGMRFLDVDATLTTFSDGRAALTFGLQTARFETGTWEWAFTVFGFDNATSTTTIRAQTGGTSGADGGGAPVVFAHPRDLDAALFVGDHLEGSFLMVDGHGSWDTEAPSLGWIFLYGQGEVQVANPDGHDDNQAPHHAERGGTWSIDVAHAHSTGNGDWSSIMVNTLPSFPQTTTMLANDLSAIPWGARAGDLHFPTHGERVWRLGVLICQAKVAGVGTDTACGVGPFVDDRRHIPILSSGGLVRIDHETETEWFDPAPDARIAATCVSVEAATFEARDCTGGTLASGRPLLPESGRLDFLVEKDETAAAFYEVSWVDLVLHYDLT